MIKNIRSEGILYWKMNFAIYIFNNMYNDSKFIKKKFPLKFNIAPRNFLITSYATVHKVIFAVCNI